MSTTHNSKHRCLSLTHDSVNFSPTKQKYSFSKGSRFKSISGPTNCEFNHHLPGTFGRRSPSFGIGDRFKQLRKPCKSILLVQPKLRIKPTLSCFSSLVSNSPKKNIKTRNKSYQRSKLPVYWDISDLFSAFNRCWIGKAKSLSECFHRSDFCFLRSRRCVRMAQISELVCVWINRSLKLILCNYRGTGTRNIYAFVMLWFWEESSDYAKN